MDNIEINNIKKIYDPYPVWIIDNFLPNILVDQILENWPSDNIGWNTGHAEINGKKNILEYGMRALSNVNYMPKFYIDLIKKLNSKKYLDFYQSITGIDNLVFDDNFRWSGLREMVPGGYQLIHSDARQHPETGFTKTLTHLIYFNEGNYDKTKHEGCLEIWSDDLTELKAEIEPLNNRMVIFLNSDTSYHGVPKNNTNRKMITFSTLTNNKSYDRSKALFVSRKNIDSDEISILGKKRAYIKDKIGKI